MKLILQKDIKNLGKTGDQVFVKKGYARNFLIPNKLALPVNKGRLKAWKHQNILIEAKKRKALSERKKLIEKLSSLNIEFEKESLKDGKLFGSVTAFEISQTLEKQFNINVDKKDISPLSLKTVGDHNITISLDSEHKTEMNIKIKGKITKEKKEKKTKDSAPPEATEEDTLQTEGATQEQTEGTTREQTEALDSVEQSENLSTTTDSSFEDSKDSKPEEETKEKETMLETSKEVLKPSPKKEEVKPKETSKKVSKKDSEKADVSDVKVEKESASTPKTKVKKETVKDEAEPEQKEKKKKKFFFF